jgi:hypothetical protein
VGYYANEGEAVSHIKVLKTIQPDASLKNAYADAYGFWKENLPS